MPQDILYKTDDTVFSYRVAGILVHNGAVLLQKPSNDPGHAFPGGHVTFGETAEETLKREFREETGAEVEVGKLRWVGEIFIPVGRRRMHQICLYYDVMLKDQASIPTTGSFRGTESMEGKNFTMGFYWIPMKELDTILVYPPQTVSYLKENSQDVKTFRYYEEDEV